MSQAANSVWINRVAVANRTAALPRRKAARAPRLLDGLVLMVIIAASGTCMSYYSRTKAEFALAMSKNQAAAEKLAAATADVERLEREIQRLKTDNRAVEELARHKLGLIREGEVVIKLDQSDPAAPTRNASKMGSSPTLTPENSKSYTVLSQ